MYAAAFSKHGPPSVLRWRELPDPVPAPDEVLIEVRACGLNHIDLDSRAGISPWSFPMPHVLGGEFAGVIAAVGADVENWRVGQPVTAQHQYACGHCEACLNWRGDRCADYVMIGTDCWGAYGELLRVPARLLVPLDSIEQAVTAASVPVAVSTALHMVTQLARIAPGETVLVPSAAGGVAGALVQCAKLSGARLIASVGRPEKISGVRALGADDVFVYDETKPSVAVRELTDGVGVDAVLDTTGGPLFAEHLASLREEGRLVTCGAHAGERVQLDVLDVFVRGLRIIGFRSARPEDILQAIRMGLNGMIRVPVDRTFPLHEAAEAHRYLDRREHVGKVMLVRSD